MMSGYEQQNQPQFERLHHPHLLGGGNAHMGGEIRGLLGTPPQIPRINHQQNFARLVNPSDGREGHFHHQQYEGMRAQPLLPLDITMQPRNQHLPMLMQAAQQHHLPPFSTGNIWLTLITLGV